MCVGVIIEESSGGDGDQSGARVVILDARKAN